MLRACHARGCLGVKEQLRHFSIATLDSTGKGGFAAAVRAVQARLGQQEFPSRVTPVVCSGEVQGRVAFCVGRRDVGSS